MKKTLKKIPVLDLPGLAAFMKYHGNEPEFALNGTRITALFDADGVFFDLSERFNNNESVNVIDFLNCQRQMKAIMFSMRGLK